MVCLSMNEWLVDFFGGDILVNSPVPWIRHGFFKTAL